MHKELSLTVEIGMALFGVSLVIFFAMFVTAIGNDVKTNSYDTANSILSEVEMGLLEDMVGQQNEMPAATAYSLIRTYGRFIPVITCHMGHASGVVKVTDGGVDTPCIKEHMTGKVYLEVTEPTVGVFNVEIHEPTCTWYFGACTCP